MSDERDPNLLACENGHVIALENFTPDPDCIACFTWCQLEVPHAPAGLIYECGARIVWRRHWPIDKEKKLVRFKKDKQLDLFIDGDLTKSS